MNAAAFVPRFWSSRQSPKHLRTTQFPTDHEFGRHVPFRTPVDYQSWFNRQRRAHFVEEGAWASRPATPRLHGGGHWRSTLTRCPDADLGLFRSSVLVNKKVVEPSKNYEYSVALALLLYSVLIVLFDRDLLGSRSHSRLCSYPSLAGEASGGKSGEVWRKQTCSLHSQPPPLIFAPFGQIGLQARGWCHSSDSSDQKPISLSWPGRFPTGCDAQEERQVWLTRSFRGSRLEIAEGVGVMVEGR